jgi:Flp pilus assembly protein TadG
MLNRKFWTIGDGTMRFPSFSLARNRAALTGLIRRGKRDKRGVAAVEFAFVLPLLVTFFLGLVESSQGFMASRKNGLLARTLADLASQATAIDNTERDNIFGAAQSVMSPFNTMPLGMSMASIVVDGANRATVCWVENRGMTTSYARGSSFTLPTGMSAPNTSFIIARAQTTYVPVIGYVLTGTFTLGANAPIYMRPRKGTVGGLSNSEQVERIGQALC